MPEVLGRNWTHFKRGVPLLDLTLDEVAAWIEAFPHEVELLTQPKPPRQVTNFIDFNEAFAEGSPNPLQRLSNVVSTGDTGQKVASLQRGVRRGIPR